LENGTIHCFVWQKVIFAKYNEFFVWHNRNTESLLEYGNLPALSLLVLEKAEIPDQ
jgi:hypothetical protein